MLHGLKIVVVGNVTSAMLFVHLRSNAASRYLFHEVLQLYAGYIYKFPVNTTVHHTQNLASALFILTVYCLTLNTYLREGGHNLISLQSFL